MGIFDPSYTDQTSTSSGSSGSSGTSQVVPYQQPMYNQVLGQANNLYRTGMPQYYGGPTVANFTPAQFESMNQTANWATGGAQDMMANQNQQYQQMMSGRVNTGEGSPYGDLANAYTQQATDQANRLMSNVRSNQVMSGQHGGSSRGDLLNNRVITDTNQQLSNNLASMYGNAYNQAQNTQMGALGQYGSIMNMPMNIAQGLYNQVGLPQQQMNQNLMEDAKKRYDYNSTNPYRNIEMYKNLIAGNMGSTNSSESSGSFSNVSTTPVQGPSSFDNIRKAAGTVASIYALSDSRLKENITHLGEDRGYNVYSWDWNDTARSMGVDDPTVGVIAQEVMETTPEAVSVHESGYYMVDYGSL